MASARGPRARLLAHHLLDLLFPPRCVSCRVLGAWICPACLARLPHEPLTVCACCGLPLEDGALRCPVCRPARAGRLSSLTTLSAYGGVLKEAIFALKYQRRQAVAPMLAGLLVPVVRPLIQAGDTLVPVPLHPARERRRGYNQAGVLARALADALALAGPPAPAVRTDLVRRTRPTADQTRLGPAERRRNMADAFAATPRLAAVPPSGRVWLVDDVLTTGATLEACAAAFAGPGPALPLHGLALARAPSPALRHVARH